MTLEEDMILRAMDLSMKEEVAVAVITSVDILPHNPRGVVPKSKTPVA